MKFGSCMKVGVLYSTQQCCKAYEIKFKCKDVLKKRIIIIFVFLLFTDTSVTVRWHLEFTKNYSICNLRQISKKNNNRKKCYSHFTWRYKWPDSICLCHPVMRYISQVCVWDRGGQWRWHPKAHRWSSPQPSCVFFPTLRSVISCWQSEICHCGNIYTIDQQILQISFGLFL